MHIHDFYAKLVATTDENPLFAVLRKLTQISDPAAFNANDDGVETWMTWVPAAPEHA